MEVFTEIKQPKFEDISKHIGNDAWKDLTEFIESKYNVNPSIEYSKCSMEKGWNIKYKKSGKSICTMYPQNGYFKCMITIGQKNKEEIEYMLPSCDKYIQEVYNEAGELSGNKWCIFEIKDNKILKDIKEILMIKMR